MFSKKQEFIEFTLHEKILMFAVYAQVRKKVYLIGFQEVKQIIYACKKQGH